jgi:hypothetical protein
MAISLMYGAGVATVMALLIIPLGCISAKKQFYIETSDDGSVYVNPAYARIEHIDEAAEQAAAGPSILMRMWGGIISVFTWVFYIIRAVITMIMMGFKSVFGMFRRGGGGTPPPPREPTPGGGTPPPPRGGTPPPPRETPPPAGGTPPPPRETPVTAAGGTPPPPREVPPPQEAPAATGTPPPPREALPSQEAPAATGTPPPPREALPSQEAPAATGTPPPPRETPPPVEEPPVAAATEAEPAPEPIDMVIAEAADAAADVEEGIDDDAGGVVGRKRRGIRLKQDLT